ncbi:MAG: glycosyltransferase family 4 protein [Bacteroides sp.]|nr:glycosyltransferase family 4 protein [Bacteroides sp.]
MKRVLIITYYWPPSAGAGVQRWLKFSKYLREYGWEPVIFTPENPEYPGQDPSLARDVPAGITVLKTRIWEPYQLYKAFTGRKKHEKVQAGFISEHKKPGLAERMATWLRGNLFIPDARRFWIRPSVRFLTQWLKENPVDAMVSTGPPHSMHLIALGVKKKTNIPWLADFRDPWTQIDFYDKLMLTRWADKKHKRLERNVLKLADRVLIVSKNWAKDLKGINPREIEVLTNGFDPEDFEGLPDFTYDTFSITHLGSLNADRNPHQLWNALAELVKENEFFRENLLIRLIGKTDISVMEALEKNGLTPFVEKVDYLPHDQALAQASQSALLLLPLNDTPNVMGITPGKLYEYLALKRPILVIGPEEGDTARIIEETQSGKVTGFSDQEKVKVLLKGFAEDFKQENLDSGNTGTEKFSRKTLTKTLASILDEMTGSKS